MGGTLFRPEELLKRDSRSCHDRRALASLLLGILGSVLLLPLSALATPMPPTQPDPDLGDLRVEPILTDTDPDLGDIWVEDQPISKPVRSKSVFLLGRVDYFNNSNVFSSPTPTSDNLVRSGITLFYAPRLGKQTYLITSIDANLVRYTRESEINYDELQLRVGIYQPLSPRMYAEIGWTNSQLFSAREGLRDVLGGSRFLNDQALRLELRRQDPLSAKVSLNTYYQLRWSLTSELEQYDRLLNTATTSLSYALSPNTQVALDYQFVWTHFTQRSRDDFYHNLGARFTYTLSPRTQLNLTASRSFGSSSLDTLDFRSWQLGLGFAVNLPLF